MSEGKAKAATIKKELVKENALKNVSKLKRRRAFSEEDDDDTADDTADDTDYDTDKDVDDDADADVGEISDLVEHDRSRPHAVALCNYIHHLAK